LSKILNVKNSNFKFYFTTKIMENTDDLLLKGVSSKKPIKRNLQQFKGGEERSTYTFVKKS